MNTDIFTRAYEVTFETSTGRIEYTSYARSHEAAELAAGDLYRIQHPKEKIFRAYRGGCLTRRAYNRPEGIYWS